MLEKALLFIIVLGVLVFVHEFGHFFVAKLCGIKVERFSLGFPPRMVGKKIGDTDYCISWIPLGGYVKMAGMLDESMDSSVSGESWEFQSKKAWQKFLVIFAGPFMNYVLALIIFAGIAYSDGAPTTTIGRVIENTPAIKAGLQPGDTILRINEEPMQDWGSVTQIIQKNANQTISIDIRRNGEDVFVTAIPALDTTRNVGRLGIGTATRAISAGEALIAGYERTIFITMAVGTVVGKMITGEVSVRENLGGPIAIADMVGTVAERGLGDLLFLTAFLSLQLGLLNLLPIPALDGGHIVFILLESLMGRPLSIKTRLIVQQIGMALLLALMAFVIINDIQRMF